MITKCPDCSTKFKASDDSEGKKTKCPKCKQLFTISEFRGESAPQVDKAKFENKELKFCASCRRKIGHLEQSYVFKGLIVCAECDRKWQNTIKITSEVYYPTDKEFEGSISFECDKCGEKLRVPKGMIGKPEVCPKCMSATLVINETLKREMIKQTVRYEKLKDTQDNIALVSWALIIYYVVMLRFGGPAYPFIALLGGLGLIFSGFIMNRIKRIERKWSLKLNDKQESKRKTVCQKVLSIRESGKSVQLCDKCGATGRGRKLISPIEFWRSLMKGILPWPFWRCQKCNGWGYVEY